jgi:hypothetical protein
MICLSRCPKRDWQVRKRWDGCQLSLIKLTRIVHIGPFTEAVWDSLDGACDLEEISRSVAAKFPELEPQVAEALVARNLVELAQQQMLQDERHG